MERIASSSPATRSTAPFIRRRAKRPRAAGKLSERLHERVPRKGGALDPEWEVANALEQTKVAEPFVGLDLGLRG